jgi:hypothetical protein
MFQVGGRRYISALYLFDDAPSSDVDLGVIEPHRDDERLVEGSNCNRANIFLFSVVFTPSPPTTMAVFGSYLSSL